VGKVKRTKRATVPRKPRKRPHAEAGERLKELRVKLVSKQAELAELLEVDQSLVSAWEGGTDRPSQKIWLKLANVAVKKGLVADALWCFEEGGVEREVFSPVTREILKEKVASGLPEEIRFIRPTSKIEQDAAASPMQFPASMISNPEETRYVRVSDRFFAPLFEPGDTLVIDESETEVAKLEGECVAIYRHGSPIEVDFVVAGGTKGARQTLRHSYGHKGVFAAWLLREGKELTVSVPSRQYGGTMLRDHLALTGNLFAEGAILLGRVIAWIPSSDRKQREQETKKWPNWQPSIFQGPPE
jgi:DNA-binding transcriptional regulator YiaG